MARGQNGSFAVLAVLASTVAWWERFQPHQSKGGAILSCDNQPGRNVGFACRVCIVVWVTNCGVWVINFINNLIILSSVRAKSMLFTESTDFVGHIVTHLVPRCGKIGNISTIININFVKCFDFATVRNGLATLFKLLQFLYLQHSFFLQK